MPGGIDMHCHIAGPKVNVARKMRPEEKRKAQVLHRTANTHSGTMGSVPSTFATGYKYAGMGYTTAFDAAIPPLGARHAHEEFEDTPCIDKGFYVLMGNNHYVMQSHPAERAAEAEGVHRLAARRDEGLSRPSSSTRAASKSGRAIRPATSTASTSRSITSTSRRGRSSAAWPRPRPSCALPHPVHIHCNNLGMPGNWTTTLETMKALEGHRGHITHIQFHSYGGGEGDENTFNSKAVPLAEYVNAHQNVTIDVGQVLFGETTSMTGDGPLGYYLSNIFKGKWFSSDTEMEAGCGITPIKYSNKSLVHSLQWAIGLEWYLLVEDPWRVVMSTDHPNGGSFLAYPQIIRLLMDRTYRQDVLKNVSARGFVERSHAGRPRPRIHAQRDRHHHPRRPGEDPGPQEQRPPGPGRRRRHHDLHAAREQGNDVRAAADGDQVGPRDRSSKAKSATRSSARRCTSRPTTTATSKPTSKSGSRSTIRSAGATTQSTTAICTTPNSCQLPSKSGDCRPYCRPPSGIKLVIEQCHFGTVVQKMTTLFLAAISAAKYELLGIKGRKPVASNVAWAVQLCFPSTVPIGPVPREVLSSP